jgi:hypothetical protein
MHALSAFWHLHFSLYLHFGVLWTVRNLHLFVYFKFLHEILDGMNLLNALRSRSQIMSCCRAVVFKLFRARHTKSCSVKVVCSHTSCDSLGQGRGAQFELHCFRGRSRLVEEFVRIKEWKMWNQRGGAKKSFLAWRNLRSTPYMIFVLLIPELVSIYCSIEYYAWINLKY